MRRLDYIAHHGIKGQRWGVRRYQYSDGSLTKLGKKRYGVGDSIKNSVNDMHSSIKSYIKNTVDDIVSKYYEQKINSVDTKKVEIGNKYVDTYLKKNTSFYRIQSSDKFEKFAFYATYKDHDTKEYAGLFGKNLKDRAHYDAKIAKKEADKTGDYSDYNDKKQVANSMKIHQLKITNKERLKIPSENSAGHIVGELIKDSSFKEDLKGSIVDSAAKMRRPSQQMLFKSALQKMDSIEPTKLTDSDKRTIYKALNLTLTNHNDQQVAMQNKFYETMKKNGYSALLDVNDKTFSSYHAHAPVIVFDTDKVSLQAVSKLPQKTIDKYYKRYNTERIVKEIPEQVIGNVSKFFGTKMSDASSYIEREYNNYLTA